MFNAGMQRQLGHIKYLLLILLLASGQAAYACAWAPGQSAATISVNLGTIRVPPSPTAIFTYFFTTTVSTNKLADTVFAVDCTPGLETGTWTAVGASSVKNDPGVYRTKVEGVGITVKAGTSSYTYTTTPTTAKNSSGTTWSYGNWGTSFYIRLEKTYNVPKNGDIGSHTFQMALTDLGTVLTLNVTGGQIISPSCSIADANKIIPLNEHDQSEFTRIGYSTSYSDFTIDLTCNAGTKYSAAITGTTVPGVNGVVALDNPTASTTAKGIAVWLTDQKNATWNIGTQYVLGTSTNGGAVSIPMRARYYQYQDKVTPGEANATATMTLTYE